MASKEADLEKKFKDINLKEKSDINILLLGETGVGKSTFINSIANYLTYTDLKKAEKGNLLTLIPSKISIKDKNDEYRTVQIGSMEDKNEYLDAGVSATQDVKTYVFPIWEGKAKVRLIDTPGMGDTRGIAQDDINCENILSYIGQLRASCYLFPILSRLDKSASKNIIFVFTNTRGTDYGPGDTFPILQEVVRDIESRPPNVKIPLNRNIFCFDNEGFRYLAAMKKDIEFDPFSKERYSESWKKSVEQCWGLIKYILGDAKNPPLKPHFIKSTSAINEARRMIVQLSQPLAEITQLIHDNLFVLKRHQDNLNINTNSLDDLKKKLFMPVINLDVIKLTQPVTVCAGPQCAEIYKVGDKNKWHYKQRCHDPCYLINVPKEIIGSPELVHCAAMDRSRKCIKCSCDFSSHMHIYYMTKTKEDKIIDANVQKNINNKERVLQEAKRLLDDISIKLKELEQEHDVIIKCCAKFAHFLQNNAITPFSDHYNEYIEYMIVREKSLGVLCNMAVVHQLEKLKLEYDEAKKSFDEALQLHKRLGESDVYITPQKIQDTIQDLYGLKHNGKKIKELYECQKKSRSKEHEWTEYVHKVVSKPPGQSKEKKEKKTDDQSKEKKEKKTNDQSKEKKEKKTDDQSKEKKEKKTDDQSKEKKEKKTDDQSKEKKEKKTDDSRQQNTSPKMPKKQFPKGK
ncbi:hypothetical protein NQ317_016893 [Molorchus minor]|uniref:G domain-containing protein n=1 Tax=Molorchus minor TaxID=1323400 RepID=A0ABQ9K606_9CUCU|nr:hypothetical protein NQ317_016893 [Molorchus minor]